MKRLLALVVAAPLVGLCGPAAAAISNACITGDYYYEILLDTDNNVSTGGPVRVVQGNEMPHDVVGIDYIVRVWVVASSVVCETAPSGYDCDAATSTASEASVHSRVVLRWNGSAFGIIGCGTTPYPVGVDDDGHALVEFDAPLDALGDPTWPVRGVFHASRQTVNDYTAAFLIGKGVQAPTLSRWGIAITALLLCAGATVLLRRPVPRRLTSVMAGVLLLASGAWATAIVIDGQFADWIGIAPVVGDPVGDSSINDPAEDILRGFAVVEGSVVYFRVDLDGVPQLMPW